MAEEPRRRRLKISSRIHGEHEERRRLEERRDIYVEQLATREREVRQMRETLGVLRSIAERVEFEIQIYRDRLERIDSELRDLERAELREFIMGPESDRFADMTIANAAYELLRETGEAMHVRNIWEALSRGGLRLSSERPTLSVTTALLRDKARFKRVAPNTYALVETQPRLIDES